MAAEEKYKEDDEINLYARWHILVVVIVVLSLFLKNVYAFQGCVQIC